MLYNSNIVNAQWNLNGNSISSSDFLGTTNAESLKLKTNNKTSWLIDTSGYLVGFENTNGAPCSVPNHKIQVWGTDSVYMNFMYTYPLCETNYHRGFLIGIENKDAHLNQTENNSIIFSTNNIERIRITSDGKLGINTNSPSALLDVNGSLRFRQNPFINAILTSDSHGVATWDTLTLKLLNDVLTINDFSPVNLSLYKQNLSLINDTIIISNGNSVSLISYLDNTDNQLLTLTSDKLAITNSTDSIDLSIYKKLTEAEVDTFVSNNGYLTTEQDGDTLNELITDFEFTGDSLKITDAGGTRGVNLRDLNANYWTQTSTNKLYYNDGFVGIGTNNPNSLLQLYSEVDQGGAIGVGGPKSLSGGGSSTPSYYKSTILLTNLQTGKTSGDGLKLESNNNNGNLRLQEAGELSLTVGNYGIRIKQDGNLKFDKLAGTNERVLITDAQGNISAIETNSFNDNLGNHIAEKNINMNGFSIYNSEDTKQFVIVNSDNGSGINLYSNNYDIGGTNEWRKGSITIHTKGEKGDIRFSNFDDVDGWKTLMTVKADGRVGIGTSNPKANLHIVQNEETTFILGDYNSTNKSAIKMLGNTGEYAFIQAGSESNNGKLKICRYNSTWKNLDDFQIHSNIVYIDGKVGIKNNDPQYALDVDGEIRASSLEGTDNRLLIADEQGKISANMSIDNLNIWHKINNDTYFNDGKVSIGTTNPDDEAVLTLYGEIDDRNKLIDFQQGYAIFSDNAGSGYGGSTRLWFDAPNNGTIVFGPRASAAMLHNIRIRAYYSNFEGYIWAKEVKVRNSTPYADYVFKPDYNLPTIEETEEYIKENKHLKEIPTEKQVKENNGIELGKMNVLLLKKVEELTLYVIELNNKVKEQQIQINKLNKLIDDEE